MKICPTCGDVYSERATQCRAHGTVLREWAESTEIHLTGHTDVDSVYAVADALGSVVDPHGHTSVEVVSVPESPLGHTPSAPVIIEPSVVARAPSRAPEDGRMLSDRYRLERKIGIGGYGAVFDAFDETAQQRVAVKVLSPALANDPEVLERFRREAIAATMVQHEGIVQVLDFDVDSSGLHFIVMEYLDGVDLSDTLNGGVLLDTARSLDIAIQCANALAAAHEAGILHRDLKPANIFLTRGPDGGSRVKIIDFGISKITRQIELGGDLTSASKVVGTPAFMSPEQARGAVLDGRSDVYALGVILFFMLTGSQPFAGASALEILEKHANQKRVPPSRLNRDLAAIPKLDALVLEAIAVRPSDRHDSMSAFAAAMQSCLDAANGVTPTSPMTARPVGAQDTLIVAPLPLPLAAPSAPAASGEVTRLNRAPRRGGRAAAYMLFPLALLLAGGVAWFALSKGESAAAHESSASEPPSVRDRAAAAAPEVTQMPAPAPDAAAPAVAVAADATPVAPAVAVAEPAAADAGTTREKTTRTDDSPSRSTRKRTSPRRTKRQREESIGIEEW